MSISLPLPENKKLAVTYRVEPGCLGPQGASFIEGFCQFAEQQVKNLDADFIRWDIIPRHDKTLTEMAYSVSEKKLTQKQADQYLQIFGKTLEEFEDHIQDECVVLINQYMAQH